MLRLRDIMTTNIITVTAETTVREAMELLARAHVSGAPVLEGSLLVGVVTATDLMAFASGLTGERASETPPAEWTETDAVPDEADEEEEETASMFFSDLWSDAGAEATVRMSSDGAPEWNFLEDHAVGEAMTRLPLATLPSDATAEAAAEMMRDRGIHRIIVADHGELVGIVSALDIVSAAADNLFTHRTYVFNAENEF